MVIGHFKNPIGGGMYVYRQIQTGLWSVGFYEPGTNKWISESDHFAPNEAAARTAWLNGANRLQPRYATRTMYRDPTKRRKDE